MGKAGFNKQHAEETIDPVESQKLVVDYYLGISQLTNLQRRMIEKSAEGVNRVNYRTDMHVLHVPRYIQSLACAGRITSRGQIEIEILTARLLGESAPSQYNASPWTD